MSGSALAPGAFDRLIECFKKQWKRHCQQLKRCQEEFSETAVHESRVATRRLLATIELLSPFLSEARVSKIQRALKQQLDTFDDLRDTQVQLGTVRQMIHTFRSLRSFQRFLRQREERVARKTHKAIKRVETKRLAKWLEACRAHLKGQLKGCRARDRAGVRLLASLNRAFARTLQLRAAIVPEDTRSIHCTRIAFKKFRYMVEALGEDLFGATKTLFREMHDYQDLMGQIQDAEVLSRGLDKFLCRKETEPKIALRLRAELLRRRQELINTYLQAADRLLEFWPRPGPKRQAARPPSRRVKQQQH